MPYHRNNQDFHLSTAHLAAAAPRQRYADTHMALVLMGLHAFATIVAPIIANACSRSVLAKLKTTTHKNNLRYPEQPIWIAMGTVGENINIAMTYSEGQSL